MAARLESRPDKKKNQEFTWRPQAGPQTAFVHCPVDEIFYGGARGGGKTDAALGKMIIRCLQFGKGERGIFFRRTYKQLEEVMLRARELCPPHGAKWREKDLTWTFPNGAWIKFGYLERDSDAQNHQGKSYCVGENTPILMGDGSYKPIKSICVGDQVATLEGRRSVLSVVRPYKVPCARVSVYSETDGSLIGEQIQPLTHPILTSVAKSASRNSLTRQNDLRHMSDRTPWRSVLPHPELDQARRACGVFSEDDRSDCTKFAHDSLKRGQLLVSSARVVLALPHPRSEGSESRSTLYRVLCRYCGLSPAKHRQHPKWLPAWIRLLFARSQRALGHIFSRTLDEVFSLISPRNACGLLGWQTTEGSPGGCLASGYSRDEQPLCPSVSYRDGALSPVDAAEPCPSCRTSGETDNTLSDTARQSSEYIHPYTGEPRRSSFPLVSGRVTISYVGEAFVCDLTVDEVNHYISNSGLVNLNTCICIEEAGTFPSWDPIAKLKATLRSTKGIPTQLLLTGNPGGPGANWVRARYIDPAPEGWAPIQETNVRLLPNGERAEYTTERIYIPARVTDNQILMQKDPNYIARLMESGSEQLVKAWLDGDFYTVDGAFFDNFDPRKHVMRPANLPEWWVRFRACDWGSAKPFCVLWFAVASEDWVHPETGQLVPKDALVVYNEWYGVRMKPDGTVDANKGLRMYSEEVGVGILERERAQKLKVDYGVMDPSAFISDGGPSHAERMARATAGKVMFRRADNKRAGNLGAMGGWDQVRGRLGGAVVERQNREDRVPMLFFFSTCTHILRTLPMMQHDELNPEDLDTTAEDHACFAAGTPIETSDGAAPIESLAGKSIKTLTPFGWADATCDLTKRSAEVWRFSLSDGSYVDCTPDHKIVCADGELRTIRCALLARHDILHISNSQERSWIPELYRRPFKNLTGAATIFAEGISKKMASVFTGLSGPISMETYPRASISITSTTIGLTTGSATCKPCRKTITSQESMASSLRRTAKGQFGRLLPPLPHGTLRQMGRRGMRGIMKMSATGFMSVLKESARNAARDTCQPASAASLFARMRASRLIGEQVDWIMLRGVARLVTCHSCLTNTQSKRIVLGRVASRSRKAKGLRITGANRLPNQDVYCLSVPDLGLFSVGGLVVSNCDTLRYGCMSRPYSRPKPPGLDDKLSTLADVTMDQLWYDREEAAGGRSVAHRV